MNQKEIIRYNFNDLIHFYFLLSLKYSEEQSYFLKSIKKNEFIRSYFTNATTFLNTSGYAIAIFESTFLLSNTLLL